MIKRYNIVKHRLDHDPSVWRAFVTTAGGGGVYESGVGLGPCPTEPELAQELGAMRPDPDRDGGGSCCGSSSSLESILISSTWASGPD